MKTEELNEYVFAKIVHDLARDIRFKRMNQMDNDGCDINETVKEPLTQQDVSDAVALIEQRRLEALAALKEFRKA